MNKAVLGKTIKIAFAAVAAILFAELLNLEYAVTAGIITILSIQNTKKETFKTAWNRGVAFACALLPCCLMFLFSGIPYCFFHIIFIFIYVDLSECQLAGSDCNGFGADFSFSYKTEY